jgi:hypothetical protein
MGATPNLALPWPELPSQADGPAAFQALATATENKMTNLVSSAAWNGDQSTHVAPGAVVSAFSQDVAATAIGWAWIDIQLVLAVGGSQGGRFPSQFTQNAGGGVAINQNTTTLRTLRWNSRQRTEMVNVSGGCAVALPLATTLIQLRIFVSTDSTSDAYGCDIYEYNVGLTQFGAARG